MYWKPNQCCLRISILSFISINSIISGGDLNRYCWNLMKRKSKKRSRMDRKVHMIIMIYFSYIYSLAPTCQCALFLCVHTNTYHLKAQNVKVENNCQYTLVNGNKFKRAQVVIQKGRIILALVHGSESRYEKIALRKR